MNLTIKQAGATCAILLVAGAAVDHYFFARTVTKTEYLDRVQTKYQVVTQVKTIVRPDGSKEIDRTIVDNSVRTENIKDTKTAVTKAPNWIVSGGAGFSSLLQPIYTASMSRRILGPIFLGVQGSTERSGGVILSVEF